MDIKHEETNFVVKVILVKLEVFQGWTKYCGANVPIINYSLVVSGGSLQLLIQIFFYLFGVLTSSQVNNTTPVSKREKIIIALCLTVYQQTIYKKKVTAGWVKTGQSFKIENIIHTMFKLGYIHHDERPHNTLIHVQCKYNSSSF